jgi:8-oxo-dGTP diphosphatase
MTRTLSQTAAADTTRSSRHFQLIVDVHLLLLRDTKVLLGRRANTGYGDGAYEPPSSRLAERETIVEAAIRVAGSQAGIALDPAQVTLAHVMHDVSGAGRIAFFLTADGWEGEIGDAMASYSDLAWFPLRELPANMIDRARVAVRNYAAGARFSTYPAFGMLVANLPCHTERSRGSRPGLPLDSLVDAPDKDPRVPQRDLRRPGFAHGVGVRRRAARVRPPGL